MTSLGHDMLQLYGWSSLDSPTEPTSIDGRASATHKICADDPP